MICPPAGGLNAGTSYRRRRGYLTLVREVIADILETAQQRNQSGPVAQHLVGAKLALRFPHLEVGNFAYSAADDQAGRAGDFQLGSAAYWLPKLQRNVERDRIAIRQFKKLGWTVLVVWECQTIPKRLEALASRLDRFLSGSS